VKLLKIAGIVLAGLVVLLVAGAIGTKVVLDAGYFKGYDPFASLDPRIVAREAKPGYVRTTLFFNGYRGERVPTLLAMPHETKGPAPCVIFLHGIGQNKEFLDEIAEPFVRAGFAFVSFDQYMCGERRLKDPKWFQEAAAFRLRPAYTVNDTRRLLDYLQTRPDIAPNRIYLAGASYGAITGSTVAAFDTRIPAVVLTYGAGNLRQMLHAREVAHVLGKWMIPAQMVGWLFLDVADPVHYVSRIAPRPVFLQNGTDDGLIATPAAEALQNAAQEPKRIKWYQSDHPGLDKNTRELVVQLLNDTLEFLKEQDAKAVAAEPAMKAAA
jgi:dienelactone hydrolase